MVTVESRIVSGTALVEKTSVVHLSAFRKEEPDSGGKVGFQRFSDRRRRQVL